MVDFFPLDKPANIALLGDKKESQRGAKRKVEMALQVKGDDGSRRRDWHCGLARAGRTASLASAGPAYWTIDDAVENDGFSWRRRKSWHIDIQLSRAKFQWKGRFEE